MWWLIGKIIALIVAVEFLKEISVSIKALRNNEDKGALTDIFRDIIGAIRGVIRSVLAAFVEICNGLVRILSGNREVKKAKKKAKKKED